MHTPSFSIYDASAGSGKTYALVKEYLKIILTARTNDAYRNILAITFTNKAVHEMKSRIVGSLSEFAKEDPSPKSTALLEVLSAETGMATGALRKKAQQIIKHLIHNYAAFDISTIDKFTHRVIRAFAHDLNLPMTFEVSLDTENLLTEAVDAIIAQAGEDETLTRLLVDFTMEKTDDDKSWDISREILDTGRLILNENNREEISHLRDKPISEFLAIKKKMAELCRQLDDECVDCARSALTTIEQQGIDHASFSAGHFPNHLTYILNNELKSTHKKYHAPEDVRINKTAKDRVLIEGILPELLAVLSCVYKNYEKKNFYNAFLKNITPLSLLNTVSNELAKIQKEQNVLSIAEFNAIIYREIQNQPAPFIYERLGERYRHFFIDEFQDTSEMQWQNLIPLIDNALAGEDMAGSKGTLMIVGDPKQSIYRWRGGKAEQFIELVKGYNPFANPDMQLFSLDTNRRSYSQIIEFNNALFRLLSAEFTNEDYADLYLNHSTQKLNDRIGGYVNISFLPDPASADCDEADDDWVSGQYVRATLAAIRQALNNGFDYRDIAVLTRKRSHGVQVADFLSEMGIPLLSSETLMIGNASEVRLVINLLRYIKNSGDADAKAGFLQYISQNTQPPEGIHDFIAAGMAIVEESQFEQWLGSASGISMQAFTFADIRKKSLYEAVEIVITHFLQHKADNAYVQHFLDLVLERDLRNQGGIADFLDYWDKNSEKFSIPLPDGSNAVRILTIHKSKGLEFRVVIMPFAAEDYSRKPKDKLWLDATTDDFGMPRILIDNSSAVEGFGDEAATVFGKKKQEELLDNINVLYVALTRAEEQLYIITEMREPKKDGSFPNNMACFFIKYLESLHIFDQEKLQYEFGSRQRLSADEEPGDEGKTIQVVGEVMDPRSIRIAQRESLMWGTIQQDAIEYGNTVHEILSFVRTVHDVPTAINMALESGLISMGQQEEVRATVEHIVLHHSLQDHFQVGNTVMNEQTIIRPGNGTVKPDRITVTPGGEVLLLDYKTGVAAAKHRAQLEGYCAALLDAGYSVSKMALVYIGEEVEIVPL